MRVIVFAAVKANFKKMHNHEENLSRCFHLKWGATGPRGRRGSQNIRDTHGLLEKNPVACAAALVILEVLTSENLPEKAREMGKYALEKMRAMAGRLPIISGVRGLGLLLGMELGFRPPGGPYQPAVVEAERVMYEALNGGLNFKVTMGNVLTLTPPLTISREEMDAALAILETSIRNVCEKP